MKSNLSSQLILFCCLFLSIEAQAKLTITIFYKYRCFLCREFITKQLMPCYPDLAKYLHVEMVPLGSDYGYDGNRIHHCVNELAERNNQTVSFVGQHFQQKGDPMETGQSIASDLGLDWEAIMNCYRSEKPKQLLEKAEVYSNKHPFVTVPAILHNKKYDLELQPHFRNDFRETCCEMLNNPADACDEPS